MQCACVWSICLMIFTYFPLRTRSTYDVVVETPQRCKPASGSTLFEAEQNNKSHCFGVGPYVGEQTVKESKEKVSETGFASILR